MSLGDCLHCWDNPCTCGEGISKPVKKIINDLKSELTAANQRIRELTEWRPMESAPRDGTSILLLHANGTDMARYWPHLGFDWVGTHCDYVTNSLKGWLPLPKGDV